MSDILKKLRLKNGLTQEEVALQLGYKDKSGYNHLENGKVKLSISQANTLSKLYGVDIGIFFANEVEVSQTI